MKKTAFLSKVTNYLFFTILLLSLSTLAQPNNSKYYKIANSINSIISQSPKAYYVNLKGKKSNVKRLQTYPNGKIKIIDSFDSEVDSSKIVSNANLPLYIDLFRVEVITIQNSNVVFKNKGNIIYGTFYGIQNKDLINFKKEIENLKTYFSKNRSFAYIKDYYLNFKTGYDFDGKHKIITANYKVTLIDSVFTMTYDSFDENQKKQNNKITVNLKEVLSIESNGTNVVEIRGSETEMIPINGKIVLKTAKSEFEINTDFDKNQDISNSEIYKAFNNLIH